VRPARGALPSALPPSQHFPERAIRHNWWRYDTLFVAIQSVSGHCQKYEC
jgi:hypothetical protein